MDVPVELQVPLFLKVLTFDRRMTARAPDTVVVAVVFQKGNRVSVTAKDEVLRALRGIASATIRPMLIDLDEQVLGVALDSASASLVYVTPLRAVDLANVAAATRSARVTSVTGVPRYVEGGLAVGVRLQGERPKLLINLRAARAEGADFSAELLKLAVVTR